MDEPHLALGIDKDLCRKGSRGTCPHSLSFSVTERCVDKGGTSRSRDCLGRLARVRLVERETGNTTIWEVPLHPNLRVVLLRGREIIFGIDRF